MRALLARGLWRSRGALVVHGVALLVAWSDLVHPWYRDLAAALLLGIAAFGLLAGVAAISRTLGEQGVDLLEPLPVSRADAWCAAALDGLLLVVPAVLLLVSLETLIFAPPVDPWHVELDELFRRPGGLLAGSVACALASLAAGLLVSASTTSDVGAIAGGALLAVLSLVASKVVWTLREVEPGFLETCPVLLAGGALLALTGLLVQLRAPAHVLTRGERARFLVPAWAIVLIAGATILDLAAGRWQRLDPYEELRFSEPFLAPVSSPRVVLVNAYGRRSGSHLLEIGLSSRGLRDYGRERMALPRWAQPRTADIAFLEDGWLFLGDPGGDGRRVLAVERPGPDGTPASAADFRFTPDRELVVFTLHVDPPDGERCRAWTVIADREGHERFHFPARACQGSFQISPAGRIRIVDVAPGARPGRLRLRRQPERVTDVILDPATGARLRLDRPSQEVVFTPELDRYLWHQVREDGDSLHQSILLVETSTGNSRTVIGEEEMETVAVPSDRSGDRSRPYLARFHWTDLVGPGASPPAGAVAGNRAAFLIPRLAGDVIESRLVVADLDTGAHRELIGPEQLPRVSASESSPDRRLPALNGIDRQGGAVVYRTLTTAHRVDVATGETAVIARWPAPRSGNPLIQVSTDGRRAYLAGSGVERYGLADGGMAVARHGRLVLLWPEASRAPVTLYPPELR